MTFFCTPAGGLKGPWLAAALWLAGCSSPQMPAPAWAVGGTATRPDGVFVGHAAGAATEAEALAAATGAALAEFGQTLGTEVHSELESVQAFENGRDTSSIRARLVARGTPVTVRDARLVRRAVGAGGGGVSAWVEIEIPPGERARLRRVAIGRTWFDLTCRLEEGDRCPQGAGAALRTALAGAGLLLDSREGSDPGVGEAAEAGAAYVLRAVVSARFLGTAGEEQFASATAELAWMDTADEKALAAASAGPIKAGHYTRDGALAAAASKAVDALVGQVRDRKVSFTRSREP